MSSERGGSGRGREQREGGKRGRGCNRSFLEFVQMYRMPLGADC